MAKEVKKSVSEKSSEVLYNEEKFKVREDLGSVAQTAERGRTKTHLKNLDEYVKTTSRRKTIERRESVASRAKISEWAERYGNIDQKGLNKYLCEPALSNSFFWKTETTKDSLAQDPILEIRENNKVYFLNGNVHGQRVFTLEQFEDVLDGRIIQCCPGIDYGQIEQESTEIEYEQDCQCAYEVVQSHSTVCHQVPGKPENQINVVQVPGVIVSPVTVENGLFTGQCQTGCLDGTFALTQPEFENFLIQLEGECDSDGNIDQSTQGTDIVLGSNDYNLLGYDEFCDVECGEECDILGDHEVTLDNDMLYECGDEALFMDDVEDHDIASLEQKLKDLKTEKKLAKRSLNKKERIAFTAALNGGNLSQASIAQALLRNGSNSVVVRKVMDRIKGVKMRRKAEREMLGMDKKEYRAFRKERRKTIKAEFKAAKAQYKEQFSGKLWRKKKRTEKRVEKGRMSLFPLGRRGGMNDINKMEIKQEIRETKNLRKKAKKAARKEGRQVNKELRKARKAEKRGEVVTTNDSLSKKEARKQKRADKKAARKARKS